MNIVVEDGKNIQHICYWRKSKSSSKIDSQGKKFPWPKKGKYWQNIKIFLNKLITTEKYLKESNKLE